MKAYKVYTVTEDCVSSKNEQAESDVINFEKYFKSLKEAKKSIPEYFKIPMEGKLEEYELIWHTDKEKKKYSLYLKYNNVLVNGLGIGLNKILIPLNVYIEEVEVEE